MDSAIALEAARLPLISVLMPVRNELRHLEAAVDSVLDNGYPRELLELLVIDGESDDGTPALLAELQGRHGFRVLRNPRRIVPTALNLGLREARGEIIFRLDGHARFRHGYLRRAVATLQENQRLHGAGAALITESSSLVGQAISLAQSSPFGVGNSRFRVQGRAGEVDSLAFAGYRREVFQRIGGFDEELVRNQDDEFNYRLRRHGMKLWMMAEPGSHYLARGSYRSLWRQYLQYGYYKILVMRKLREVPSLRSVVPLLFTAALALGLLALPWSLLPLGGLLAAYALFLGTAALQGDGQGVRLRLAKAWAMLVLQVAYGLGEWLGVCRFALGWRVLRRPERLSR